MVFRTKLSLSLITLMMTGQAAVAFAQGNKASTKAQAEERVDVAAASGEELPGSGEELPGFDDLKLDLPAQSSAAAGGPAKTAGAAAKTAAREPGQGASGKPGQEDMSGMRLVRDARVPDVAEPVETHAETRATLSDKAVKRVIGEHASDIRYCHERLGKRGKLTSGELALHFTVTPSGRAEGIRITASERALLKLDGCIKQRVQTWRFPSAESATAVAYPILLGVTGVAAR